MATERYDFTGGTLTIDLGVLALPGALVGARQQAAGYVLRDRIRETMESSAPAGRRYRIPGTSAYYTASARGQAPAIREGLYRDSWKVGEPHEDAGATVVTVYSDLIVGTVRRWLLALLLELGTARMRPRPHIRPSIEDAKPDMIRIVRAA